jgi:SAM-dependent methyltransferase
MASRDNEATGWFEPLYAAAEAGEAVVPWDDHAANAQLAAWTASRAPDGRGRRAVVVGCGLGDDAEHVAGFGFETVAFDIAPTAIRGARRRFPGSRVSYVVADLLALPDEWRHAFDLVVEVFTVQALPDPPRPSAIAAVSSLVARGGTLVAVASARSAGEPADGPPWPLTRAEIEAFATGGVEVVRIEDLRRQPAPFSRRWRAEFTRSPDGEGAAPRPPA